MSAVHLPMFDDSEATTDELEDLERARPKTRADCADEIESRMSGKTFCPFVSCKYNTFLTIKNGEITQSFDDIEKLPGSNCSLDYEGGAEYNQIAAVFGISKQAVESYMKRVTAKLVSRDVKLDDFEFPVKRSSNLAQAEDYAMNYVSWAAEGKTYKK